MRIARYRPGDGIVVGVIQDIERDDGYATRKAIDSGDLSGSETLHATATLRVPAVGIELEISDNIDLE